MQDNSKFIASEKLEDWLNELQASFEVWVPRREGEGKSITVVYRPYEPEKGIELRRKPTESAKHTIFPRSEALFNFKKNQDPEKPGKVSISISMPPEPEPRLVFGLLSCDARGFLTFDPVYNGSGTQGKARDVYYLKRRNSTVLIVKACKTILSTCFCNWVGGGPASTQSADVLATEVEGGMLLTPVTEQGEAVLGSNLLQDGSEAQASEAEASHKAAETAMGDAPDIHTSVEALVDKFSDDAFWEAESSHCLSCGACTYLCPTCYCFNITDESLGIDGVRLRNWDACMTPLFTMEASGHNPRAQKANRLKNRVGHKFSYYPSLHERRISCCGCGRCIKSCPSSVDIRRIVTDALGLTSPSGLRPEKKEEAENAE